MQKITTEKVGLGLIALTILTNPLTNQYIISAIEWALIRMTPYTVWVTVITGAYMVGLMFFYMWSNREEVKIPKKSSKTLKAGKLIET